MSKTTISWTEMTWNPVRGCSRVSPGCQNCYAERMAARELPGMCSPATDEPFAMMHKSGPRWTGKVELIEHMLDIPLRRKKPTTFFVNSMSDLFHESLPDEAIDRVFAVMALCPQDQFQVLTKRAERMREYYSDAIARRRATEDQVDYLATYYPQFGLPIEEIDFPIENVRLGVSVEDQQRADERLPELMKLAEAGWKTMVSAEPLLGPVDMRRYLGGRIPKELSISDQAEMWGKRGIDWVIVGGGSGPGARPCDLVWIRSIVDQCKTAEVPCFVKQLGTFPVLDACRQNHFDWGEAIGRQSRFSAVDKLHPSTGLWRVHLKDRKGGDPEEWPAWMRVREMPESQGVRTKP